MSCTPEATARYKSGDSVSVGGEEGVPQKVSPGVGDKAEAGIGQQSVKYSVGNAVWLTGRAHDAEPVKDI